MRTRYIDSAAFSRILAGGAECLGLHKDEVNGLNVFPIPDGDTGSNMLMTISGGAAVTPGEKEPLGSVARRAADSMLFSARGNSGVILSQFADGIASGLSGLEVAGAAETAEAFRRGVEYAYASVLEPVEGTMLTVVREASDYASSIDHDDVEGYLSDFLKKADETLKKTPDMLPVLKNAGVVDSGGAGLIYIIKGAAAVLDGDAPADSAPAHAEGAPAQTLDLGLFDENSELEYGYCTEVLLRLQKAKTDPETFDADTIRKFLRTVGDSIVCFKTGTAVKIHVHTKEPYRVLQFCQKYGEYLTVKIENMSLQHSNLHVSPEEEPDEEPAGERRRFAVVAVASGEGMKQTFLDMGADYIVDGGQSCNPSADDFIESFRRVNADTVFVFPNNGNVITTAKQAVSLYSGSDVRVIESRTVGDCYAALSMLDTDSGDAGEIERSLTDAMEGVVTAGVSRCVRNTETDGFLLRDGQYIGFVGKTVVSADSDRFDTAAMLADRIDFAGREVCIIVRGADSDEEESQRLAAHVRGAHPGCEVFVIDGGQDVYSYILIAE